MNANIAHFDEQVDPTCTFCKALRNFPAEKETYRHQKETYRHLFYTCTATSNISVSYFNKFFQGTRYNWEPNFILLGANNNLPEAIQLVINVEIATFIHFILEHRKNNKIPLLRNLEAQTSGLREIYMKSKVYQKAYNCFRQWLDQCGLFNEILSKSLLYFLPSFFRERKLSIINHNSLIIIQLNQATSLLVLPRVDSDSILLNA